MNRTNSTRASLLFLALLALVWALTDFRPPSVASPSGGRSRTTSEADQAGGSNRTAAATECTAGLDGRRFTLKEQDPAEASALWEGAEHRCLYCHQDAHTAQAAPPAAAEHVDFLGRRFDLAAVHDNHSLFACSLCHACSPSGEVGVLTLQCADCHGGTTGLHDALCSTCHRTQPHQQP